MNSLRTIHRTTRFAFQNIWRNIWLSLATVVIFVLTLLTINLLLTLNVLTDAAIQNVEDRIDVSVYFEKGTTEDMIFGAHDYLAGLSQVEGVEYVSAEEALIRFSNKHSNNTDVISALDIVETNPFGGSLIVTAQNPEDFDFILEALNNPTFGEAIREKDFSDHENVIERINEVTSGIRLGAFVLAGVFTLIAVLIVLNSIRISIYTHREEIGIMRLVGASNSFIRLPFVLEAVVFSIVATFIAAAMIIPAAHAIEPQLNMFFGTSNVGLYDYYTQGALMVFGLQALGLAVLSVIASIFAMGRYLKV